MKKWFRILLFIVSTIILFLFVGKWVLDEPLPKGTPGPEAELLAQRMLENINKDAWDSTNWVLWNYKGARSFIWDKKRGYLKVDWDQNEVWLDLNDLEKSKVSIDGQPAEKKAATPLVDKAWAYFCNDSFWLNAPAKVKDEGTLRSIVALDGDRQGLLITYTTGGVTPGDSYLWILDENARPVAFKMWVSILPIKGIEASWENWEITDTKAVIAKMHKIGFLELPILGLKTGNNLSALGIRSDPFDVLLE